MSINEQQPVNGDQAEVEAGVDALKTFCATHPKTETRLRCGKCARPICPKCLVYTPVGARCRMCADMRPLPTFQIRSSHYLRAVAAAIAIVVVGGLLWAVVSRAIPFLSFWIVLLMGYLIGEFISRATNRKRGRPLQVIAGATLLLTYAARGIFLLMMTGVLITPGMIVGLTVDQIAGIFTNLFGLLFFALSVYVAVTRL